MDVLVIGGVSIDTLIYTPEIKDVSSDMSLFASRTTKQIGGTGAGKAFMMAKFSKKTTLVCQAAKKDHHFIKTTLQERNIHPIILETNETEEHTNIMHGNNHRLSIFTKLPNNSNYINEVVTDEMLKQADMIFLNINAFCKPLISRLAQYKEKVIVDVHDYKVGSSYHRDFLEIGSYLFTSCIYLEDQQLFLQESLKNYDLEVSVVTCNKEGSIGINKDNKIISTKALENVDVVDSNGAGDAFVAGFMVQYFKHRDMKNALIYGNVCGAFSCESQTLIDGKLTEKDINQRYLSQIK